MFARDKPIFSSEDMLHKAYYRKSSVGEKTSGRRSQGAWRQKEWIGGKPPVLTLTEPELRESFEMAVEDN
jgi:hypothetical protein